MTTLNRFSLLKAIGLLILAATLESLPLFAQGNVNVLTWHNDIARTGQNLNETHLTTSNVVDTSFGKLCSYAVDGQVYAQPLVVTGVNIGGTLHTVVYLVTQKDNVYAFDGTNFNADGSCILLLPEKTLLMSGESPVDCHYLGGCPSGPYFGILGTPAIDSPTGSMFLVAETQTGSAPPYTYYHRLHALRLTDLSEQPNSPVQICRSGCGGVDSSTFSKQHLQRPGLLWLASSLAGRANNMVYVALSMVDGDTHQPPGWIFGYNAQNLGDTNYPLSYDATPNGDRGGIWQDGAGLAAGPDTNVSTGTFIYFSTGDGTFNVDTGGSDVADSFVKLTPSLAIPGGSYTNSNYFTPSDQQWRQCNDIDYGSGGTTLIPGSGGKLYAVKGDKENLLWVMDRLAPGGYTGNNNCGPNTCTPACVSGCLPCNIPNPNLAEPPFQFATSGQDRSTPAFWGGSPQGSGDLGELYMTGSYSPLSRYPVRSSCSSGFPPVCNAAASSTVGLGYAASPSISSTSTFQNGIVWAIRVGASGSAVLNAFDANSMALLYDSGQCKSGIDQPGTPTKFSVPTVANGRVYLATTTDFDMYGIISPARVCN